MRIDLARTDDGAAWLARCSECGEVKGTASRRPEGAINLGQSHLSVVHNARVVAIEAEAG